MRGDRSIDRTTHVGPHGRHLSRCYAMLLNRVHLPFPLLIPSPSFGQRVDGFESAPHGPDKVPAWKPASLAVDYRWGDNEECRGGAVRTLRPSIRSLQYDLVVFRLRLMSDLTTERDDGGLTVFRSDRRFPRCHGSAGKH